MLLVPLTATVLAPPAAAQRPAVVAAAVHSMMVDANGLTAGAVMRFEVHATPGARRAEVVLEGTHIVVPLREVATGVYQGSYTVKPTEIIHTHGQLTARLTHGDQTVSRSFPFPPHVRALTTAATPPAGPVAAIERFVMRPAGRLAPGRELRFRLNGAPGGKAWVDIPGVVRELELDEVRPGVYEGHYTIRRRDDLDAFERAVATLTRGNQRVTATLMHGRDGRDARDEQPPVITDMSPAQGERVGERGRTRISAKVTDEGRGVDPASIRLRIDGRDVSRDARFEDNEVRYREDLPPGRHNVELTVRDQAGNTASKSWSFDVAERAGPPPVAVLPLEVTSHAHGAIVSGGTVNLQGRTAPHASVRIQVDQILEVGGRIGFTHPVLDQTVQADAAGRFQLSFTPAVAVGSYDVRITSTAGGQVAEQRLTLRRG